MDGDRSFRADETGPTLVPRGAGGRAAEDLDAVGIAEHGLVAFQADLDGAGVVGAEAPLDDIVVMLAPVYVAVGEAMGAGVAVVVEPWKAIHVGFPVYVGRDNAASRGGGRWGQAAARLVSIYSLELADPPAADQLDGPPEAAIVFAPLLRAALVDAA